MNIETLYNSQDGVNIKSYLNKCDIDDIEEFIRPTGKYIEPCEKYSDHYTISSFIINKKYYDNNIYIIQDSDVDGICSATIAYQFLIHLGYDRRRIIVKFHKGKQHGLNDIYNKILTDDNVGLVWVPDAGTNDAEECKKLYNKGWAVLITDHHEKDKRNPYCVIINNQCHPKVDNKALSGTGVTFKYIQFCCSLIKDNWYKTLLDMVAIANIGDVMAMNNYENRTFNYYGFRHIVNPFLKYMINEFINEDITPQKIAFNICPKLNAVCRSNNQELKADLFKAFVGINQDYEDIVKRIKKQHKKQKDDVDKLYIDILKNEKDYLMLETDLGIRIYNTIVQTPYTGLIATKLCDKFKAPVMVIYQIDDMMIGSCRSPVPLKTKILESELLDICAGHEQSFGVGWSVLINHTKKVFNYIRNIQLDITPTHKVLYSCNIKYIEYVIFDMWYQYRELWGKGIEEPVIHLTGLHLDKKDVKKIGSNGIKFTYGYIEFVMFGVDIDEFKAMLPKSIEVVGSVSINEWNGNKKRQVIIQEVK